ncbi:GGDEF domain-containing protein [Ideonella sp. B7]|uniref:GGDEF domain-containing protein n=1 Tax=Ideonella benzenivorans TaxID=2831643 RepID=UPI001CEC3DB7|nr:GGDEF domain-containing protein [Ideonella benzenivorans]MCA6215048.1 GGDEF domain-containing protein [Ideonella benzenivorans]
MDVRLVKGLLGLGLAALASVALVETLTRTIAPWDQRLYPLVAAVLLLCLALLHHRPQWAPRIYLALALVLNAYLVTAILLALFNPLMPRSPLALVSSTFWMPLGYVLAFLFLERRAALGLVGITFTAIFLPSGIALSQGALAPWGAEVRAVLINMALAHFTFIVALLAIGRLRYRYQMARERMVAMQVLASTDPLTGLPNRRAMLEQLDNLLALAQRGRQVLSVLLLDIDHFKQVNDNHGHEVGDQVLSQLGQVLSSQVRACDLVGRWGGEEFLLLAPATLLEEARELAERIRQAVATTAFPHGRVLTVSLGVTQYRPDDHREALLRRADQALYRAKAAGRNQSCCAAAD